MQTIPDSIGRCFRISRTLSNSLVRLAAVVAVTAASGHSAYAAVIYSGVQNVNAIFAGHVNRIVDFDFAGGWDAGLWISDNGTNSSARVGFLTNLGGPFEYTTARFVGTTIDASIGSGSADLLADYDVIGAGSSFIADSGGANPSTTAYIFSYDLPTSYQWTSGQTGYFGFQFNPTGSQVLYGWGKLTAEFGSNSMNLVDWAYETSGSSILAGVTVPEPTSAILCLLGVAGLAKRQRRPPSSPG
jgi:hypothetical protein